MEDVLFAVGNGSASLSRSNAFEVLKDGRIAVKNGRNVLDLEEVEYATARTNEMWEERNTFKAGGTLLYSGEISYGTDLNIKVPNLQNYILIAVDLGVNGGRVLCSPRIVDGVMRIVGSAPVCRTTAMTETASQSNTIALMGTVNDNDNSVTITASVGHIEIVSSTPSAGGHQTISAIYGLL